MTNSVPVTAAVTPVSLPESFTVPMAVALARDLVIQMYDRPVILKKHNLTEAQALTLEQNAYFQKLMAELAIEWNAPRSAQERLAVATAVGLETVLPDAIARISIKNEPLQGVAQMVKVLADIAGANAAAKQKTQAPGERFTITIDLGGDKEVHHKTKPKLVIESTPVEEAGDGLEIRTINEGFGALLALSPDPEAS